MGQKKSLIAAVWLLAFFFAATFVVHAQDSSRLYEEAVTAANRRDFDLALSLFGQIIAEEPSHFEAHLGIVGVNIYQGRLNQIQQEYEEKLAAAKDDVISLCILGEISFYRKELDKAAGYLKEALAVSPSNIHVYAGLINVALEKGDFPGAKEYLDAVLKIESDSYTAHLILARYHFRKAEKERDYQSNDMAIKEAQRAMQLRPYEISPYLVLGICYFFDMNYTEAQNYLKKALDLDKLDAQTNALYALTLATNREYAKAKSHLLTAKHNLSEIDKIWNSAKMIDESLEFVEVGARIKPLAINILAFLVLIFAIIVHEYSHGWFANKLGDPTAKDAGRLSFNPLAHLDIFGSVVLPVILILSKADFVIGYAKPVPINPQNFKRPKRDEILISLAGPLSNIVFGIGLILLLSVVVILLRVMGFTMASFGGPVNTTIVLGKAGGVFWTYVINVLKAGIVTSFVLAGFNLIPIPPLDGSHILMALLPSQWMKKIYAPLATFGFFLILILARLGVLDILLVPVFMVLYILFAILRL